MWFRGRVYVMVLIFWGGRLLQVDTFTARRYSLPWISWVSQRRTPEPGKPAKDTDNKGLTRGLVCGRGLWGKSNVMSEVLLRGCWILLGKGFGRLQVLGLSGPSQGDIHSTAANGPAGRCGALCAQQLM